MDNFYDFHKTFCNSYVAKEGGVRIINLADWAEIASVMHEKCMQLVLNTSVLEKTNTITIDS